MEGLEKYGHNLKKLWADCRSELANEVPSALQEADSILGTLAELGRRHEFRYIRTGFKQIPREDKLRALARALVDAARRRVSGDS